MIDRKEYKLGDILEITSGGTPNRSINSNFSNGTIPWVKTGDLKSKYLLSTPEYITEEGLKNSSAKIFPVNTVLVALYGATIGACSILGIKATTNQACGALLPSKNVNAEFLYYYLKSIRSELVNLGQGGGQPNISGKILKETKIKLPSLEDQIRIATLLSKAEAIIKQRKESIDLLSEYVKSTFLKMFGDPIRNERGWKVEPMNNVIIDIISGTSYGGEEKKELTENELGVLKISAVTSGFFNPNEFKSVSKSIITKKIVTCQKGMFLFSRANTRDLVAACCIIPRDYPLLFLPDKLWSLIVAENIANKTYLNFLFKNENYRGLISSEASGGHDSMLNISMAKFRGMELPLPPIEHQNQFANIVEKAESLKAQYQSSLAELENLYGSLNQKAFKGELNLEEIDDVSDMNSVIKEAVKSAQTIQDLSILPEEILKTKELIRNLQTSIPIVNPAIENALQLANTLNENYTKFNDVSLLSKSFQNQIENWNKAFEPIKNLTVLPQEIIDFQRKIEMLQSSKLKVFIDDKQKQRKLVWGNISFKQIAEIIKEAYSEHYFNNEMLVKYMIDEQVIFPNYYSSDELKKFQKLNESDDYKSFIFTALRKENPFFKLEQFFYDGIDENFVLKLREDDYDNSKSSKNYSGIYFKIIE